MEQDLMMQMTLLLAGIKELADVDPVDLLDKLVTWKEEIPIE